MLIIFILYSSYISYLSLWCVKILDKSSLREGEREGGLIWLPVLKIIVHHGRIRDGCKELEAANIAFIDRKQRELKIVPSCISLWSSGSQVMEWHDPHSMGIFPPRLSLTRKSLTDMPRDLFLRQFSIPSSLSIH